MSMVQLYTHSAYSLLSGTMLPEKLVEDAKNKGYTAVALTDRNVMYGIIPFYNACKIHNIKPILGLTGDVLIEEEGTVKTYPLIFLAKNNQGFQNLIKISSVIQTESKQGIPLKWLKAYGKDLFVLTPGLNGEIEELLLSNQLDRAKERILFYQKMFDVNSFFLSIQNLPVPKVTELSNKIRQISVDIDVPVVNAPLAAYSEKDDYFAWKSMEAIRDNKLLSDLEDNPLEHQQYLRSAKEQLELFQEDPLALKSSERIAESCHVELAFHQQLLPKYPLEGKSADQHLTELCEQGLNSRLPSPSKVYIERLRYELSIIKKMKFSDYFLIVADFTSFARKQGIMVGPGRGSAAGSLVAYCLGITDVDPIRYDLLFERFLNPERVTMPDIDIDFPDIKRDEVIRYVADKYGKSHVAQIITYGTFAAKAAIRDAARVFGLSSKELEELSRAIPSKLGITLDKAYQESTKLQKLAENELYQKIFRVARKIEGLPRHTSTHAAGVIISDKPLVEIVPLQEGTNEVYLTQYPMGLLEEIGLLKMDFLGLRNLTLIESILKSIQFNEHKKLDLSKLPLNDQATFQLLQKGQTTGVFQLESDGMRNVLRRLKPTEFEDIVAVNALYRPGPMDNIPTYIKRKHGDESIIYPHPDLEDVLKKTYGVIVYQEQIMQIASIMAGFSLGEADLLRRAVSKKKRDVLDQERKHFVEGALRKGYSETIANNIYDLIVRFADYGFNRSHAVAYSIISYQLAYLKAHYPLHFMASLLTSVIGNEDKTNEYIKEIKQMGYIVHGPSINESSFHYQVTNDGIRFSLASIKGVGIQALKEILRARNGGAPFEDIFDFCVRVSLKTINRKVIENLIYAGCFDDFGYDRAVLLATLDVAIDHARIIKPDDNQLDTLFIEGLEMKPKYVIVDPIPLDMKLQYEKQVLGLFLSKHPASIYREVFGLHGAVYLDELQPNQKGSKIGVYITEERKIRTKKGDAMSFLEISDETSDLSAVVFPNVYKKYSGLLKKGEILFFIGNLEIRNNQPQFIVQDVESVDTLQQKTKAVRVFLRVNHDVHSRSQLLKLKNVIENYKGDTPVIMYYEIEKQTVQLPQDNWIELDSDCIQSMKRLLGENNVVLR